MLNIKPIAVMYGTLAGIRDAHLYHTIAPSKPKWYPSTAHQGAQECARRVKQRAKRMDVYYE